MTAIGRIEKLSPSEVDWQPLIRSGLSQKASIDALLRKTWNELRGGEFDSWGTSICFFETDAAGVVIRQIETYKNGSS